MEEVEELLKAQEVEPPLEEEEEVEEEKRRVFHHPLLRLHPLPSLLHRDRRGKLLMSFEPFLLGAIEILTRSTSTESPTC